MEAKGLNPFVRTEQSRALHSIYFEILGETGWVGLFLFLSIAGTSFLSLRRVKRAARENPQLLWLGDAASALQLTLVVMLICGAFIGIAYQPYHYYMFALSFCLQEYLHRVRALPAQAVPALSNPGLALGRL